ncbi:MAG TPA: hypothetical protein VLW50_06345 [Streptosporangiaceae bacterium]|nr:hypothetical protein [Streptosporangiaceae bacterium]
MTNSYGDQYPSTAIRYGGLDSAATVTGDGLVTGVAYGRARLVAVRSRFADTAWVSVVPTATLGVSNYDPSTCSARMERRSRGSELGWGTGMRRQLGCLARAA